MKHIPQANDRAMLHIAENLKVQFGHATPSPKVAKAQNFGLFEPLASQAYGLKRKHAPDPGDQVRRSAWSSASASSRSRVRVFGVMLATTGASISYA